MTKIKVGVVRGGPSSEYDVSLKTGGEVLKHLPDNYHGHDVLVAKNSDWHLNGFLKTPAQIFNSVHGGVEVVFNAMHGEFGEDGKAQQIFESFNVPYTGSGVIPSFLAMQKHLARDLFLKSGLKIPRGFVFYKDDFDGLDAEDCAREVFNSMAPPWVAKSAGAGSSLGVSVCQTFPELIEGIQLAADFGRTVLVEEHIKGKEATCGILEDFRGENHYALPVVEIMPPENKFSICPAGFDNATKIMIEEIAKIAHQALGCRHYSRADFIVSPRGVYLLEVNTLPGLTSESLLPKAAAAAGLEFPQLLDHLIKLALTPPLAGLTKV
ncbi:hypothetical protein KKB69_00095 [Patescibacteria group bacterium]|nr:hypothetical protein [Patescibacteria group bacterium]